MTEDLKNIFNYLQILLRYIASGFMSVATLGFIDGACKDFLLKVAAVSPWILLSISGILGFFTYGIHQALADKVLYQKFISRYRNRHKLPEDLHKQIVAWKTKTGLVEIKSDTPVVYDSSDIRFNLFTQSYLRKASDNKAVLNIQHELDKKLAILNFLYCTFYSLFLISLLLHIKFHYIDNFPPTDFHQKRIYGVLGLSILTAAAALFYDYRTTVREMWVVEHYFQNGSA